MKGKKLKLSRPVVTIDIETTGLDVQNDRIVEICVIKREPNGKEIVKTRRLNPTIPIPKQASDIHGITDEMVKGEKTFKEISASLGLFIDGCDVVGYNSDRFDIPLLLHEFERAGIYGAFENVNFVDVFKIYAHLNPRTLDVAYADYCGKSFESHSAENDAKATIELLEAMAAEHGTEIGETVEELSKIGSNLKKLDILGVVLENKNGEAIFGIGKHKGQKLLENQSYCEWILKSNFTENTKTVIRKVFQ